MANEDKPRDRPARPHGKPGDQPAGRPSKPGEMRSRGFKGKPAGAGGGDGERGRARGFKDRPDGLKPNAADKPVFAGDQAAEAGETVQERVGEPERISKYMARAGIASRRDVERMIEAGRVTLNGHKLSSPAVNVTSLDAILVDGNPIPEIERTRLWLYHKPAGLVTTNRDPEGRPTVFERLPGDMPRVMTVGRLDINTEGLLLLTNDGGLSRMLELPQTGWLRRYRVRAHGKVDQKRLDDLKNGIAVDGVFYGSVEAEIEREQGSNLWLMVGLREGKNREVKNILGALGLEVNRLIRVSYGPFQLAELPEGAVQEIKGRTLRDQLGERLIEEAGANFEAPVRRVFSNKVVKAPDEPPRAQVDKRGDWVRSSPVKSGQRGDRKGGDRADVLSRLDTRKPDRGDRKPAKRGEPDGAGQSDKQRHERKANVWMAPGARPQGKKPRPRPEDEGARGPARGKSGQGAKPRGGARPSRPGGARPSRPAGRGPKKG